MISYKIKGNLKKTNSFLERAKEVFHTGDLDKYGKAGVEALSKATPVDSGKTSESWYYKIERTKNSVSISFYNSNIQNGTNVAVILQYGHATRNGAWVNGIDYINPALKPIFDKLANDAWKEATKA